MQGREEMNKEAIIEKLMLFGLTKQEANIYLCLLDSGELTGYEASKLTGISRSNVYGALANMAEKGAVHMAEGASVKYRSVSINEFCTNRIREMEKAKQLLKESVRPKEDVREGYITIEGFHNIQNKVYTMMEKTEHRLYISAPKSFVEKLKPELVQLLNQGRRVVVLTDEEIELHGLELYLSEKRENQLRMIADSGYVLTGDISGKNSDTCLYSGQTNFVNVFKEAMRNEIELIKIKNVM